MFSLPRIETAGSLTLDNAGRILCIYKDGSWDLPKGMVEKGDSYAETAIQETSEETGLPSSSLSVLMELIPTTHLSKYSKTRSLKHTRWFLLRCHNSEACFKPQSEEGIEHCQWFSHWELDRPLANCPARVHYLIKFWLKVKDEAKL